MRDVVSKGVVVHSAVVSTPVPAKTGVRNEKARAGLVCVRCGYPLKGIGLEEVCPECGYPVERSLPGGLLKRLDVYELGLVRPALGQWCAVLIVMGLFNAAAGVACPGLGAYADLFMFGQQIAGALIMGVAAFAWLPLMRLRRQTQNVGLRWSAVMTMVSLGLAALCLIGGKVAVELGAFNEGVLYLGIGATLSGRLLMASFFVLGAMFSSAIGHDGVADAARHRWVAALGAAGALLPVAVDALRVPGVAAWVKSGSSVQATVGVVAYGAIAIGGVLVGLACVYWAGACGRTERRVAQLIESVDAEALKKQLAGAE